MPEQPIRRQRMEELVTPSPRLSCCPKHPAAAAALCLSAPPTAVSSGCLTDSVGPVSDRLFFFFLTFSSCHITWNLVSSLLAVTLWFFGNCQLVFHTNPRKTSLGRVSLWPSLLPNDLQSQAEINWRDLRLC